MPSHPAFVTVPAAAAYTGTGPLSVGLISTAPWFAYEPTKEIGSIIGLDNLTPFTL